MSKKPLNLQSPCAQNVIKVLKELDYATTAIISKQIEHPYQTVNAILGNLYKLKQIHIYDWHMSSKRRLSRVYAWGEGIDMKQPPIASMLSAYEKPVTEKLPWPRCDIAAAWLINPINSQTNDQATL